MDPQILQIIGVAAGLAGGKITKAASKRAGSKAHKIGSPLAAIIAGGLVAAAGGQPDVLAHGGTMGAQAILAHTVVKNLIELFRRK